MLIMLTAVGGTSQSHWVSSLLFLLPNPTCMCRHPPTGLFLLSKLHFLPFFFLTFKIIIGGRIEAVVCVGRSEESTVGLAFFCLCVGPGD